MIRPYNRVSIGNFTFIFLHSILKKENTQENKCACMHRQIKANNNDNENKVKNPKRKKTTHTKRYIESPHELH